MLSALERQFHGTCALVRVQLMRAAERSDVEECFPIVRNRHLISNDDEKLIRACFAADDRMGEQVPSDNADNADNDAALISKETIARLHMIVSSQLNVADSA